MESNFPFLSLDLSPPFSTNPSSFPELLTQFLIVEITNSGELSKLNTLIIGLEAELKKVQAFQRELPLSFLILHDAVTKLRQVVKKSEDKQCGGNYEKTSRVNLEIDEFEKKTWMSSAQLWSPTSEDDDYEPPRKNDMGAVLSFSPKTGDDIPKLSLIPSGLDEPGSEKLRTGGLLSGSGFSSEVDKKVKPDSNFLYQTARKRRRCWSPELHRRFVDALEKLGGSQVATPKQIRDLMQVDGLTNDEVKSHLQKYRLHVRKIPTNGAVGRGLSTDDDRQHSSSPDGPFHLGRSKKCNSSSVLEEEEDEEKSDGQSWKAQKHM